MGLMHPMYNHQGRSRKVKRKKTQSLLAAEKKHNAWLKSMGLDKRTKREPQTMISVNYHTEQPIEEKKTFIQPDWSCLLYTSPSPRDVEESRMPSSA